jgi:glycosyltransferase involved in cell wall biosynthesis
MQTAVKEIVDIVLLGTAADHIDWPLGTVHAVEPSVHSLSLMMQNLMSSKADAFLFWDSRLKLPELELVLSLVHSPVDVWHSGLRLRMGGLPRLIDFVQPTWMYNRDPDTDTDATSWRLSLRGCLIKASVLKHFRGIRSDFKTLEAASLELGYRFLTSGVMIRYHPGLLQKDDSVLPVEIPFSDETLFIRYCAGRKWSLWALIRAILTNNAKISDFVRGLWSVLTCRQTQKDVPFPQPNPDRDLDHSDIQVTVLIPTLNRYSYLRRLLSQIRHQTISPAEIIVVDQTPEEKRDRQLTEDFSDLPLKMMYRDRPGQCSARNEGLRRACGNYILFLDDDEDIPPELIELHVRSLQHFHADVSSGAVNDDATLPAHFRYIRCSDVFPTGNTMIRRDILLKSGLFDLAYDCGDREDGDLGMRIYLSGALMIFNPAIRINHHHAAEGGLRTHGVGLTTYVESRKKIWHRKIPSSNEIYFYNRYFTAVQAKERMLLSTFGTFSLHAHPLKKALKLIAGLFLLPDTILLVRKNMRKSAQMRVNFPQLLDQSNAHHACD